MRARFDTLLNFGWTMAYFGYWGLAYGTLLGLVEGTMLFPVFGSIAGSICGLLIGTCCGFVVGTGVALVHSLSFTHDTDLVRYRRRLSRGVGLFVVMIGIGGLLLFLAVSRQAVASWSGLEWVILFSVVVMPTVWASLSMAYTASYYPDQMVRRLIRQTRMLSDGSVHLEDPTAALKIEQFLHHIYPRRMHLVGACLGIAGAIVVIIANPSGSGRVGIAIVLALGAWVGLFAFFAMAAHSAIGNVLTIMFLKRVVLSGLSPHWSRVTLTLIAFLLTLVMVWWMAYFAFIWAFYIAYRVYHTLALPTHGDDKTKRKEKAKYAQ